MMGSRLTWQEESILTIWKDVMELMENPVPDRDLIVLLDWAKQAGFPEDPEEAFSLQAWESLGAILWDALRQGDTSVSPLVATWGVIDPVLNMGTEGNREETEEGSGVSEKSTSGTCSTLTPSPKLPRAKFPSPANLECRGAPQQAGVTRPPPFAPVCPAVCTSPAPGPGQPAESQQTASITVPPAPLCPWGLCSRRLYGPLSGSSAARCKF